MAEYDNTNTGTLFRNDKGDNPKRPDYTGKLDINGTEYRLSAWLKESKSSGAKFLSLKAEPAKEQAAKPAGKAPAPAVTSFDDDLPF